MRFSIVSLELVMVQMMVFILVSSSLAELEIFSISGRVVSRILLLTISDMSRMAVTPEPSSSCMSTEMRLLVLLCGQHGHLFFHFLPFGLELELRFLLGAEDD